MRLVDQLEVVGFQIIVLHFVNYFSNFLVFWHLLELHGEVKADFIFLEVNDFLTKTFLPPLPFRKLFSIEFAILNFQRAVSFRSLG